MEDLEDGGLAVLVDFITFRYVDAKLNANVSAGVRSRLSLKSFRAFRRLLPCLHTNTSCGVNENGDTYMPEGERSWNY